MSINIPETLSEKEYTLYEDSQMTITLVDEDSRPGALCVNIYLEHHDDFPEIIPADTTHCARYDGTAGDPSHVSKLPDEEYQTVKSAVDQLLDSHDVTLTAPQDEYGICHTCMGEDGNCGMIAFAVNLEAK
ncbi:hypothetical protein [Natrinema sp. DC36]|uniref:hypothetical protein n=1 Tax=Natrinema sp. DC36 TaxID=2878680 RepID=UPI001CF0470C|nr:hypothetical protein [Natrinema sp. DC36]